MQFLSGSSLLVFIVSSVLAGQVACRPFPASEGENNRNQVLDTSRKLFGMGSVECCSITLAPTTFNNGSAGVQVTQSCIVIMADECPSSTQSTTTASPTNPTSSTTAVTSVMAGTTSPPSPETTSMPESTATTSSSSLTSSSTSDTSTSTTQLSFFPPSSTATTSTPTSTTSSLTPSQTSLDSSAITTTKQSSALPKIIGAFAGIAMLLLIVAGIFGYKRQKKLQEKVDGNKISWPTFR